MAAAMGREVFGHIGAHVQRDLIDPLLTADTPQQRLQAWAKGLDRFYDGGKKNCLLGSMVLGGGADRYTQEIAGTFQALIDTLTGVIRDAGVPTREARRRARGAIASVQGALITARGLGDAKIFGQVLEDLSSQLLRPATSP